MAEHSHRSKEEITYALFDMDPAVYYQERYAYGNVVGVAAQESRVARGSISYQKASNLMDTLRGLINETGNPALKVLEVGCGSGTFGARIKHFFPNVQLYGVDMSSSCIDIARRNGFDEAVTCDVVQGLPYADNEFDFIYTMDYFGHIEFRSKDAMIGELRRVTRPGGYGFHGIESGFIDYLNCNPKDSDDVVRKYVYMEGHIGVESLEDIVRRFSPFFEVVKAFPFPIRPLLNIRNVMTSRFWGEEFCSAFAELDTPQTRAAADLVIGWINRYLTGRLLEVYGDRLLHSEIGPSNPLIDTMLTGSGFAMITVRKKG